MTEDTEDWTCEHGVIIGVGSVECGCCGVTPEEITAAMSEVLPWE